MNITIYIKEAFNIPFDIHNRRVFILVYNSKRGISVKTPSLTVDSNGEITFAGQQIPHIGIKELDLTAECVPIFFYPPP